MVGFLWVVRVVVAVASCGSASGYLWRWIIGFCGSFGGLWILYIVVVGHFGDGSGFCGWWQCQSLGAMVASDGGG